MDFADTTYSLTYEVHDAADADKFGKATVEVTVLGNYWVGDLAENGSLGVVAFASDGNPRWRGPSAPPPSAASTT
jgi:hypothetical protein